MLGPTTLKEAKHYRYGKWAGNPKGAPYRDGYCLAEIMPNERGAIRRQCGRRAGSTGFCGAHDPERLAKAEATRNTEYAAAQAAQRGIEKEGEALVARLEAGATHYHVGHRFGDSGYRRMVCVPFEVLDTLLRQVGR